MCINVFLKLSHIHIEFIAINANEKSYLNHEMGYCTCSCSVLVHFWQFLKAKVPIFPYLVEKTCKVLSLDQNKHLLYFNLREQTHLEKKLAEKENYLEGLGNQIANLSKLVCFVNHCSLIQQTSIFQMYHVLVPGVS